MVKPEAFIHSSVLWLYVFGQQSFSYNLDTAGPHPGGQTHPVTKVCVVARWGPQMSFYASGLHPALITLCDECIWFSPSVLTEISGFVSVLGEWLNSSTIIEAANENIEANELRNRENVRITLTMLMVGMLALLQYLNESWGFFFITAERRGSYSDCRGFICGNNDKLNLFF